MPKLFDPPRVSATLQGWTGGLNVRDPVAQLAPNEARVAENVVLDSRGGISKRWGGFPVSILGDTSKRILSIYCFMRGGSASPQIIYHTSEGKLYSDIAFAGSPTTIASGLSTTAPFSYETFLGKVWMGNGVDDFRSWDGSTQVTYAAAPKGAFTRLWKDTMWISGVTANPDRTYSSAAGDPTTWPAPNFVDIAKGDGDPVRALATDGQFLIVGKRFRTDVIYDPVTFANRALDSDQGFESHFAVVSLGGNIYFLSDKGVLRYIGDSPSVKVSGKVDPYFTYWAIDKNNANLACACPYGQTILFFLPETSTGRNTLCLQYYPSLADQSGVGAWMLHRPNVHCGALVQGPGFNVDVVAAGQCDSAWHTTAFYEGNEFDWSNGASDFVPFSATFETGMMSLGDPTMTKYLKSLRVIGQGELNIFVLRDFSPARYRTLPVNLPYNEDTWSSSSHWNSAGLWDTPDDLQVATLYPDAYGRHIALRFQDAANLFAPQVLRILPLGTTESFLLVNTWMVLGVTMEGKMLGERPTVPHPHGTQTAF